MNLLYKVISKVIIFIGVITVIGFLIVNLTNLVFKDALLLEGIILLLISAFIALGGNPSASCAQGINPTNLEIIKNCRCCFINENKKNIF